VALQRWGNLTPEALGTRAPPQTGRRGRSQDYPDCGIDVGLMLRLIFGRLWRQTAGMLNSIMDLLDLELPVPEPARASAATIRASGAAAPPWLSRRA